MIEGSFKILKQYLQKRGEIFSNIIIKEIDFFVNDYNQVRPHYVHSISIPDEVHENPECVNVKPILERINKERQDFNRKSCKKKSILRIILTLNYLTSILLLCQRTLFLFQRTNINIFHF